MKKNTASAVRELIEDTVRGLGFTLWDVTYEKDGRDYNLVVSIDKDSGVSIEDCKTVTDAVEPIIDEADPIENSYCLEVSSAGVYRVLRTDAHLEYAVSHGRPVTASAYTAVFGRSKTHVGKITGFDSEKIYFDNNISADRKSISRLEAEC